jgi:uncharacterized protein YjeT (DUF2065 family)
LRVAASTPGAHEGTRVSESLLAAFALVLVIEGLLPLAAPRLWRESFRKLVDLTDGQLRFIGLVSIVIGLAGFWLVANA